MTKNSVFAVLEDDALFVKPLHYRIDGIITPESWVHHYLLLLSATGAWPSFFFVKHSFDLPKCTAIVSSPRNNLGPGHPSHGAIKACTCVSLSVAPLPIRP